jgi:hypothetical protein
MIVLNEGRGEQTLTRQNMLLIDERMMDFRVYIGYDNSGRWVGKGRNSKFARGVVLTPQI